MNWLKYKLKKERRKTIIIQIKGGLESISNKDNIYFSREEYNKLMQIINDNKNSKDEEIKHRAEQLSEKFEKYIYLYEKQTEGKLEEGVIFRAYSNELKWIVQECMYLVRKKAKTNYYEELKIKENKGDYLVWL